MGNGVRFSLRVTVGHILQAEGIGSTGDGDTAVKTEGFFPIQEFPDLGNIQTLPAEGGTLLQNAGDPGGKAGNGGKVQQEFRRGDFAPKDHVDQDKIGKAVSQQAQRHVHEIPPQHMALILAHKAAEQPQILLPQVLGPVCHAEDPQVLGVLSFTEQIRCVADAIQGLCQFLPVVIAPPAHAQVEEKSGDGDDGGYHRQPEIEIGQQGKIDKEAQEAGGKGGQGRPDRLGGLTVVVGGGAGLFAELQKPGVQKIGKGGSRPLPLQGGYDVRADGNPGKHGVLLEIAQSAPGDNQQQGKQAHGGKKCSKAAAGLDDPQNQRGNEHLRHGFGNGKEGNGGAYPQDTSVPLPGKPCHVGNIAPDTVFWFFFHIASPRKHTLS